LVGQALSPARRHHARISPEITPFSSRRSLCIPDLAIVGITAPQGRSRGVLHCQTRLRGWVVTPNHVHLLILPRASVAVLMRWLKASTARNANRILGRTGQPFWQDESCDHYLRNSNQVLRTIAYIEENPVSAGLAHCAEAWRWPSSGRCRLASGSSPTP
jgi:REP element-mobilizing transposase RayT